MTTSEPVAEAVEVLQQLGLKEYEARCFVGLTRVETTTAKRLGEMTEVPRTRVYDAIRVLESHGLVEIQHSSPQQFRAVPLDEAIETLFYTPLKRRRSVSQELFDDHWKDAHGPLCARLPGLHQYIQYHLGHDGGRLWPSAPGVSRDIEADEQLDGVAVLAFESMDERKAWVDNSDVLMADEQNAFEETIGYETIDGNSTTHVDHRRDPAPNGDDDYESLHVLFRKNKDISIEEFHEYIAEEFVPSLA